MPITFHTISISGQPDPASLLDCLPPGPGRILLESGAAGPAEVRRWSFAAAEPFLIFTAKGRHVTIHNPYKSSYLEGDPFAILQRLLDRYRTSPPTDEGAPPLTGGAIGYIGYDAGRHVERIPEKAADDIGLPDIWLGFYDALLALNHQTGQVWAVDTGLHRAEGLGKLGRWVRALKAPARTAPAAQAGARGPAVSTFSRPAYEEAVRRALAYIAAGDIFQVNLSQRFTVPWAGGGRPLFDRLRAISPAPFSAYLDGGHWQVVSTSPERFLRAEPNGRVEMRPIKGTRPRGATPAEDEALAQQLMASDKEQAELAMIVDLQRSDLGRICRYGSVQVPELRRLEGYPSVWHTVATVEGRLAEGARPDALLRATFPGGSITGAPKLRAMEIIEELEPVRRGIYTGAIGYLGFDGQIDLNVAIRTAVIRAGHAHVHVGGGIVAGSDPAAEYEETLAKASGLMRALGVEVTAP